MRGNVSLPQSFCVRPAFSIFKGNNRLIGKFARVTLEQISKDDLVGVEYSACPTGIERAYHRGPMRLENRAAVTSANCWIRICTIGE
jgi:hypothetical protein